MSRSRTQVLAAALGLALACAAFTGAAAADNGNGNGNANGHSGEAPGKSGEAPGQQKKAEQQEQEQAEVESRPAPQAKGKATAPGQLKRTAPAAAKGKAAKPAKPAKPATAAAPVRPLQAPAPQSAAGKITICHATGSATNPYVEITISRNGLNGHGRHGDIVPAPAGGCPTAAAPAPTQQEREQAERGQRKVTICHATGSATNPFVVISIAEAGWLNGHSKHEGDRFLGYGTLDFDKADCGAAPAQQPSVLTTPPPTELPECPETVVTTQTPVGVWHKTGSRTNPYVFITPDLGSAHYTKHADDIVVYATTTTTVAGGECAAPTTAPTPASPEVQVTAPATAETPPPPAGAGGEAGGVAGVQATLGQDAQAAGEAGGVLGVAATLGRTVTQGTLPFTGLPLWLGLAAGLLLLGAGLALRRAEAGRR